MMGIKEMELHIEDEKKVLKIKEELLEALRPLPDDETRRRVLRAVAALNGIELSPDPAA